MRLICPNCGAQYEVPDDVIPESGRDVQCSNCGDTWFQHHPNHAPAEAEAETESETSEDGWDNPAETQAVEPETESADQSEPDTPAQEDQPVEAELSPSRQELDPAIANILRQEAEFEEKERAKESRGGIETQPDLGLNVDDSDERSRQAQTRMARLRGESEDDDAQNESVSADDIDPSSRRNLLPDIDDINSSLDSDDTRQVPAMLPDDTAMPARRKKGGFRRGFITGVLIVAIVSTLYLLAPAISKSVPSLDGVLAAYVNVIDSIRVMLNDLLGGLIGWIKDMLAPAE